MTDDDRASAGDLHERRAEQFGQLLVPLVRYDAAYVVCLDDVRKICGHCLPS
ncbi:hypothetical protein [Streptomyces katrae]|uniref:hypothetical protein n=1 Tax=Streptomyces katrae TaxID=68223 RepID=UPI001FE23C58|nr:hypothetical protein [Streptomyces katrae]